MAGAVVAVVVAASGWAAGAVEISPSIGTPGSCKGGAAIFLWGRG
jgi:hypothetical protein